MDALAPSVHLPLGAAARRAHAPPGAARTHAAGDGIEFHDHRPYVPGDDLRRLDWRALARNDTYVVRRHRHEAEPRCDVMLDASGSMGVSEGKAVAAATVAALMAAVATRTGARTRLHVLGGMRPAGVVPPPGLALGRGSERALDGALARVRPAGEAGLGGLNPAALAPGSMRVVVTDALTRLAPADALRPVARGADGLVVVQVLDAWEAAPSALGTVRLVDAEGPAVSVSVPARVDEAAIARYRARLEALQGAWDAALSRHALGPRLVRLVAPAVDLLPDDVGTGGLGPWRELLGGLLAQGALVAAGAGAR